MQPSPLGTASLNQLQEQHFGFAFGVNIPPSINPDFRPLLALMTAEKAVLIPWSIQETFLSFRPRWLIQFYRFTLQPSREFRKAEAPHLAHSTPYGMRWQVASPSLFEHSLS